jgi:biotin synthase
LDKNEIDKLCSVVLKDEPISEEVALAILKSGNDEILETMTLTNALRMRHFGNKIHLCSILNAKSGACEQDCAFCTQSTHHDTEVDTYNLCSEETIADSYKAASELPIGHYGVVTSGEGLDEKSVEKIRTAVSSGEISGTKWCASLGIIKKEQLLALKEAGLKRFHHNLETAESFFPEICSTHSYKDRLEMVREVKRAGLQICCGGILGLGESFEQRVELAFALKNEQIDSIPLNFHIPVPGTRLENLEPMKPLEILRSIAMFRMVNPTAEIKVCAGKVHLGDLQSMIFYAGATGMMIGPLLTIAGRDVEEDLKMLRDLEMDFE